MFRPGEEVEVVWNYPYEGGKGVQPPKGWVKTVYHRYYYNNAVPHDVKVYLKDGSIMTLSLYAHEVKPKTPLKIEDFL